MVVGGIVIGRRINRERFLFIWILLGSVCSLLPIFIPLAEIYEVAIFLIVLGFSFGVGFPLSLSLVPYFTKVEERGRVSGVIFIFVIGVLPILLNTIKRLDIFTSSLMLAVWRSLSFGIFLIPFKIEPIQFKSVSYLSIIRNKTFLLYFLPWLAFSLVNYFGNQGLGYFYDQSVVDMFFTISFIAGCVSCLVSGWLIDLKGRRFMIIVGLTILGLEYALLSLFPNIQPIQVLYGIVDGAAFGIFTVAFISVVWGDMSNGGQAEKFYALGTAPHLIALMLSAFVVPMLANLGISSIFSLAAFFIFIAIIPIFFAPELLPEEIIRKKELEKYVEEARKMVGKGD
jgi:MFS family permease